MAETVNQASANSVLEDPASDIANDGTGECQRTPIIAVAYVFRHPEARPLVGTFQGRPEKQVQPGSEVDQDHQRT